MALTLLTSPSQLRRLRLRLLRGGIREIGGWIVAEELSPGRFELVGMTVDYGSGTRSRFTNTPTRHDEAFERIRSNATSRVGRVDYLGEWHSHPTHPAVPSDLDVSAMTQMVETGRPPFAVLLIVRLGRLLSVEASLTLFQKGARPEPGALTIMAGRTAHG